mmetsp:Transcript_11461/g.31668  ORF Transcript_11461/g.31668 Transcript_11461/m.31668 type:complete len:102 (+) Transcript_11461:470-775(+)
MIEGFMLECRLGMSTFDKEGFNSGLDAKVGIAVPVILDFRVGMLTFEKEGAASGACCSTVGNEVAEALLFLSGMSGATPELVLSTKRAVLPDNLDQVGVSS